MKRSAPAPDEGIPFPADERDPPKTDARDRELARQLRAYGAKHRWQPYRGRRPRDGWEIPLAELREQYGADAVAERVAAYIRLNITKPQITSGRQFAQHWDWIGREIAKAERTAPPAPAERLEEVAFVEAHLSGYEWPAGAYAQFPGAVQQSARNLRAFHAKRRACRPPDGLAGEHAELLALFTGGLGDYLLEWFRAVHGRIHRWKGWGGDLGYFVWRPDHPDFVRAAETVLQRYGAAPGALGLLVGGLK